MSHEGSWSFSVIASAKVLSFARFHDAESGNAPTAPLASVQPERKFTVTAGGKRGGVGRP